MKLWWLLALVGCDHPSSHHLDDGAPVAIDGDPDFCDVSALSGHAAATIGGTSHTFSRVYAGGVVPGGPFAPDTGLPLTPMLLFTDGDHLSPNTLYCCAGSDSTCCSLEGVVAHADSSAVGSHVVQLTRFQDPSFTMQGTITITDYVAPFQTTPSRIAGSITTTSGGDSVNAMFDTTFCELLLSQTI